MKDKKTIKLSSKMLKELTKALKERKAQIIKELNKITKEDKYEHEEHKAIFPDYGDKNDESANEIVTFSNNISLGKSLEDTLKDIESTLERIKKGTYGTCKYCKEPISMERLKIRPASSACIPCKKRLKGEA